MISGQSCSLLHEFTFLRIFIYLKKPEKDGMPEVVVDFWAVVAVSQVNSEYEWCITKKINK